MNFDTLSEEERAGFIRGVCASRGITTEELFEAGISADDLKTLDYDTLFRLVYTCGTRSGDSSAADESSAVTDESSGEDSSADESSESSGTDDFMLGMITNSNSVGGFKGITGGDVTLNDGLFEVPLIRMPANIIDWPMILSALTTGASHEKIVSFKTSKLTIECEEELPWTTDGEYGGSYSKVIVRNIPEALPIILSDVPGIIMNPAAPEIPEIEST